MRPAIWSICLLFLIACSPQSKEQQLQDIHATIKAGEERAAIIELKNLIKAFPGYAPARLTLGRLYLKQGDYETADKELSRAYELSPRQSGLVGDLTQIYVLQERYLDAIELGQKQEAVDSPKSQAYQIVAHLELQQFDAAKSVLQTLPEDNSYAGFAKAYWQAAQGDLAKASETIEPVLAQSPDYADAVLLSARIDLEMTQLQSAIGKLKHYRQLRPEQGRTYLLLANAYFYNDELQQVKETLEPVLKANERQPFANALLGMTYFREQDYEQARNYARIASSNGFSSPMLGYVLGASFYQLEDFSQAYHHLAPAAENLPQSHPAHPLLAMVRMKLGYVEEAVQQITTHQGYSPDFLLSMGTALADSGEIGTVARIIEQVEQSDNLNAETQLRLGLLKLRVDDTAGFGHLEQVILEKGEYPEAELAYAMAKVKYGEYGPATKMAKAWQQQYPERVEGYNLEAYIHIKQQQFEQARAALEKALSNEPGAPSTALYVAQLAQLTENYEWGEQHLNSALARHPQNPLLLKQIYLLSSFSGRTEQALNTLEQTLSQYPKNKPIRALVGYAQFHHKHFDKAAQTLAVETFEPEAYTEKQYWLTLYETQLRSGKPEAASDTAKQWLEMTDSEPAAYALAIYDARQQGQNQRVQRLLEQAVSLWPQNLRFRVFQARWLMAQGQLNKLKPVLDSLQSSHPEQMLVKELVARYHMLMKNYRQAELVLMELYQQQPQPEIVLNLAKAKNHRDKEEAKAFWQSHLKAHPDDYQSAMLYAEWLLQQQDYPAAAEQYQSLLETKPDNAMLLNNLAWLRAQEGQLKQAKSLIDRAVSLSPDDAQILDTQGTILLQEQQPGAAVSVLRRAYELTGKQNPAIGVNLLEALVSHQQWSEAKVLVDELPPLQGELRQRVSYLKQQL
ncbi:hypothetical protein HMF8227_01187 [Saliniradius amylolyticus]|uniref:Uncharacterized protein n=1 Tax=Saliniradius amylolyticus TaxID=2183582 RepID=A0A2S2E209_9ALTE|nr:XrtA/PEP-CTERM system TPR-repeat protein PrsT [Saliniradius amylolyticus]AWL11668.1 hypothetical protein HMF8227_01187 [Saliniradius amylolyticus]